MNHDRPLSSVQATRRAPPRLPPPSIPAAHEGRGVGQHLLDDERRPLAVTVLAVHLEPDDIITLYWNGVLLERKIYLPADGSQMTFLVAPSRIPEGSGRVHYTWEDPLAPIPDESTPLDVMVKREVPGGVDPDPFTEINENLTAPGGIPPVIDANQAAKGVDVIIDSYENRQVGDIAWLSWHGEMVRVDVPSGVQSFTIHVDQDVIARAGDTDQLVVRYEIRDEVNNRSKWSPSAGGVVDLGGGTLDAPRVPSADDQGRVDYEALTGDLDVVLGPYPGIKLNDVLILTWKGESAGGGTLPDFNLLHTVVAQDLITGAVVKVPKDEVAAVLQGQARLRYRLLAGANPVSRSTSIRVVGRISLAAPRVLEADNSTLDPVAVPAHGASVRIERYASMAAGDLLLVEWIGKTRSGGVSYHNRTVTVKEVQVGKPIELLFDKAVVQHIAGGSLELYYTLTSIGGAISMSGKQSLTVKESSPMPRPEVRDAKGDVLDPKDAPNGTTVICRKGLFAAGDELEMWWEGLTQTEGDDTYREQRSLTGNQAQQDQAFEIDPKYITRNIEKDVKVYCRMLNRPLDSDIFTLKIRALSSELAAPTVKEAAGSLLDPMQARNGAHVTVSYPGMQVGDLIEVRWRGVDAPPVQPVSGEASGSVDVLIPVATVGKSIGRSVQVSFIRTRDGIATASQVLELVVDDLDKNVLSELRLDHVNNGQLDLDSFTGSPLLRVEPWPFIATGQRYWLVGTGEKADGSAYRYEFRSHIPVVAAQVSDGLAMEVYRNELETLASGKPFTLNLMVNFQGENDPFNAQAFEPCEVVVTGGVGVGDLPEPVVTGSTGNVLDPINARTGARVRVSYPQMTASDQITLSWKGVAGAGTPSISPVPGNTRGYVDIDVPASAVGANIGKSVEVSYIRTRSGSTRNSQVLSLRIQYLNARNLERPTLDEAREGKLDLDRFVGNPTLRVKPWPFIAEGQRYWLVGTGTLKGGGDFDHVFRQNVSVTAAEVSAGLVITQIERSELEKLELDKPLRLTLKVNFAGTNDFAQTQGFPVLEVLVTDGAGAGDLPEPEVDGAPAGVLNPILARAKAVVKVAYPAMVQSDQITLQWVGVSGPGTPTIAPVAGRSAGFVNIDVPATAVGANIGKTVEVKYTRSRGGNDRDSGVLPLRIQYLQSTDLKTAVLVQAVNGELDLKSFTGDAQLRVELWPFAAVGQRYWLVGRGTLKTGGDYLHAFRTNVTLNADDVKNGKLELPIQRSQLTLLKMGEQLSLTLQVNFEGVNDSSNVQNFPPTRVTVVEKSLQVPEVQKATGANKDRLDMNDFYSASSVRVTVRRYAGMAAGDTVMLRWLNPRSAWRSEIVTVGALIDLIFQVPRMELIDSIGQTVPVNYTVLRSGGASRESSDVLSLVVARQPILLEPPSYAAASRTVTVRYAQAAANHTVKVRWDGVQLRETDIKLVNPNGTEFVINQAWVTENAGKTVLVNYSIYRQLPTERLLFSQVLRLKL